MHTVAVDFYGGPFDGQTQHWPISETLDRVLNIRPDHDPAVLAIYRLRSITLGALPRATYGYEGTVAAPAA
jgi:hypothetical protein